MMLTSELGLVESTEDGAGVGGHNAGWILIWGDGLFLGKSNSFFH